MALTGMPTAVAMRTFADAWTGVMRAAYGPLGLGLSSETTTAAAKAAKARTLIMGDGGATPGLDNSDLKAILRQDLDELANQTKFQNFFGPKFRQAIGKLEGQILAARPPDWTWEGLSVHPFDAWLTYLNATHPNTPVKPANTPVLTPRTGGALMQIIQANAVRIVVCHVGTYDHLCSPPSNEAGQVALTGSNSGYDLTLAGVVPAGVRKLRVFMGLNGAATGTWFYLKDVTVVAGAAYPSIPILEPSYALRQDITPPAFGQAMMFPEAAALFGLAFAGQPIYNGFRSDGIQFQANAVLDPSNVSLGPSNGFLGIGNQPVSGILASKTLGSGLATGTIQTTNTPDTCVQGFRGAATSVRARVATGANGTIILSAIGYTYVDATNPLTPQAGTIVGPLASIQNLGDTVDLAIPAGRIVLTISGDTKSGTSTTGAYLYEGVDVRTAP